MHGSTKIALRAGTSGNMMKLICKHDLVPISKMDDNVLTQWEEQYDCL